MVLRNSGAASAVIAALIAALAGGLETAEAQTASPTLKDRMDSTYERVLSKHGVDVSGHVDAEYLHSELDGAAKVDTNYAFETSQYTSFDLDMQYRAFDDITAKASLRFYQDWQTFFATRSRILAARWISVDGNIARTLGFNAGDFRQKYSQLTLWSPQLDLVYEPMIFSRMRKDLMDEQYLGDNDRVLQGANLNFARRFDGPLSELRVDAIGSRVRRGEFLDADGYHGFRLAKSDMDRFALAGNAEAFLFSNLFVGGTYLTLLDDQDSYRQQIHSQGFIDGLTSVDIPFPAGLSLNDQDSVVARDIRVISGRAGADISGFLNNPNIVLEFTGEYTMSSEANRYAWHFKKDTVNGVPRDVSVETKAPGKDGKAMLMELDAGYKGADSAFGVGIAASFLKNDAAFLNPLAQSPTFVPSRIMNTENDNGDMTLYSTFDALDNGVYKFSPSRKVKTVAEGHHQAPYSKTSYNNGTFSPEDLSVFHGDPVVQLVLPFGSATPNRTGPAARLTGQWNKAIFATVDFAMLKEVEGMVVDSLVAPLATFNRMGGGAQLDAAHLFSLHHPLEFQASFARNAAKRDMTAKDKVSPEVTADLLMAGFRWQMFSKWGLLGGFEQAKVASPQRIAEKGVTDPAKTHVYQYKLDETQKHFRAGLEYTVTRNAYLMVSGGMISVDRARVNKGTADNAEGPVAARDVKSDFNQMLAQAVIKVKF
jgi:hypothetical protein